MASALQCDICGSFYTGGKKYYEKRPLVCGLRVHRIATIRENGDRIQSLDLCPECATVVCEFIDLRKKICQEEAKDDG